MIKTLLMTHQGQFSYYHLFDCRFFRGSRSSKFLHCIISPQHAEWLMLNWGFASFPLKCHPWKSSYTFHKLPGESSVSWTDFKSYVCLDHTDPGLAKTKPEAEQPDSHFHKAKCSMTHSIKQIPGNSNLPHFSVDLYQGYDVHLPRQCTKKVTALQ